MAERNIDDLDAALNRGQGTPIEEHPPASGEEPLAAAAGKDPRVPAPKATRAALSEVVHVEINYPDPTLLSIIVRDVSRWSAKSFVMEPSVNTKIQIFAPHRMPASEAYDLFLASLSVVNLRAVQIGKIVKIVPVTLVVVA